jgi:hypothetical protein
MSDGEFDKFMKLECNVINYWKWLEGERIGRDPGQEFVMNWIRTSAAEFRLGWDVSNCKNCKHIQKCGYKLKQDCENFEWECE